MRSTRIWTAGALCLAATAAGPGSASATPATFHGASHLEANAAFHGGDAMLAARRAHGRARALIARAQHELQSAALITIRLEHQSAVDGGAGGAQAAAAFDQAAALDSSHMQSVIDSGNAALDGIAERAIANDLTLEAGVSLDYANSVQGAPSASDTQGQAQGSMDAQMTALNDTVARVQGQVDDLASRIRARALSAAADAESRLSAVETSMQAPAPTDASASADVSAGTGDSQTGTSASSPSGGTSPSLTAGGGGSGGLVATTNG